MYWTSGEPVILTSPLRADCAAFLTPGFKKLKSTLIQKIIQNARAAIRRETSPVNVLRKIKK